LKRPTKRDGQEDVLATGRWRDEGSVRRYEHVIASEESAKTIPLPVQKARRRARLG